VTASQHTSTSRDALRTAIQLIRKGERDTAFDLVKQELNDNPENVDAWIVMAQLVDDPRRANFCWQKVLEFRPDDERAHQRLIELGGEPAPIAPLAPAAPPRQAVADVPPWARTTPRRALRRDAAKGPALSSRQIMRNRLRITISAAWQQFRDDWSIFRQNRLAMVGVVLIVVFGLMAISHPILLRTVWSRGIYDPQIGYDVTVTPWPADPSPPRHWLGTDAIGRDILSMLLKSTQPSFALAVTAALMTAVVSTLVGAVSAYFRGPTDAILSNVSDALLLLPVPIVMVVLGARFYNQIGTVRFGLLYGLLAGASSAAIVMRSHALTLMNRPFIEAARVAGAGPVHIIFRHLIPHMLPLVAVHMMMTVTGAIIADGFIAAFGIRTDLRLNWGTMVYNAFFYQQVNPKIPWNMLVAPSVTLSLFAAAFYFVARGLQDVSDPRKRDNLL